MNIIRLYLIAIIFSFIQCSFGQSKRFAFAGNFNLNPVPFWLDASPSVVYRVDKKAKILPGVGVSIQYFKPSKNDSTRKEAFGYGGKFTFLYRPIKFFNFQAELEAMNINSQFQSGIRKWQINPLLGARTNLTLSKMIQINASLMYNFNYQKEFTLYPSAWIFRFGVQILNLKSN